MRFYLAKCSTLKRVRRSGIGVWVQSPLQHNLHKKVRGSAPVLSTSPHKILVESAASRPAAVVSRESCPPRAR